MPSVSPALVARSRLSESSSRLTRSGSAQTSANAALIGSTAADVAWMRAMRVIVPGYLECLRTHRGADGLGDDRVRGKRVACLWERGDAWMALPVLHHAW